MMSRHPQEKRPRSTRQPFAPQPGPPAIELPLVAPPHNEETSPPHEGRVPADERGVTVIDFYI
jgi:hypothetical protein